MKRLMVLLYIFIHSKFSIANLSNVVSINDVLENPKLYNDTFVLVSGTVKDIVQQALQVGYLSLTQFKISDNTGSVNVLAIAYNLHNGDSVLVVGRYMKERKIGKYIVDENIIDASTLGQYRVIKGIYLNQTEEQERSVHEPISFEDNFVPVNQIETPLGKLITYLSVLGVIFAAIALIPLALSRRRFNLALKIQPSTPRFIKSTEFNTVGNLIAIDLSLFNIKTLPPEINSQIKCKFGKNVLNYVNVVSNNLQDVSFPIRVEGRVNITVLFDYQNSIKYFSSHDNCVVQLQDEFCKKMFVKKFKFNFVLTSEN